MWAADVGVVDLTQALSRQAREGTYRYSTVRRLSCELASLSRSLTWPAYLTSRPPPLTQNQNQGSSGTRRELPRRALGPRLSVHCTQIISLFRECSENFH